MSLRNKDRFKEEEVGLVTLPLEDVVKADPKYFRCRDTNKVICLPIDDLHGVVLLVSLMLGFERDKDHEKMMAILNHRPRQVAAK